MSVEPLEHRLRDLAVTAAPDAGRVTARVLSTHRRTARWRWRRATLSAVAALVIFAVVAYFAPATSTVVARVPLAGATVGASERVTTVGASAVSAGYTITLVGAYADSTRTELRLHVSPAAMIGIGINLSDQFGRTYGATSSSGNLLTGDVTAEFEPLAWPDAMTGARIEIHVSQLDAGVDVRQVVRGAWTLHATLGVDEGNTLANPAPISLGSARLSFTSVIATPGSLEVDLDIAGVSLQDLEARAPDTATTKGSPVFTLDLRDSEGNSVLASDNETQDWFWPIHVRLQSYISAPGKYLIVAGYDGQVATRSITVP